MYDLTLWDLELTVPMGHNSTGNDSSYKNKLSYSDMTIGSALSYVFNSFNSHSNTHQNLLIKDCKETTKKYQGQK